MFYTMSFIPPKLLLQINGNGRLCKHSDIIFHFTEFTELLKRSRYSNTGSWPVSISIGSAAFQVGRV